MEIRKLEKISDVIKKHDLKINGIVHVGAHTGQEIPEYIDLNINKIVCFEPLEENYTHLKNYFESKGVKVFKCALGNSETKIEMNVSSLENANYSFTMSSSILNPKKHLCSYPDVLFKDKELVDLKKLSSFKEDIEFCNFLVLDVQGYEYEVLEGAENLISQFDYVYSEVNRDETYEGNKLVEDIDQLLMKFRLERVETWWAAETWGDALYIKKSVSC